MEAMQLDVVNEIWLELGMRGCFWSITLYMTNVGVCEQSSFALFQLKGRVIWASPEGNVEAARSRRQSTHIPAS